MGTYIKYSCDSCGFEYERNKEIFWIDSELNLHVSQLTFQTSDAMGRSLASGYYGEYYCYDCKNMVEEFLIDENPSNLDMESIIQIIESHGDNLKIIKFDDKFQNCISCQRPLELKSDKLFSYTNDDEFNILDEDPRFYYLSEDNENDKFWGVYHGYYCDDCEKQINKFVIKQNSANLDKDVIRSILESHTNDLTVLIFDYENICPNCHANIKILDHSSICPNCGESYLIPTDMLMVD